MIVDRHAMSVLRINCDGYIPSTEIYPHRLMEQMLDRTIAYYLSNKTAGPIHVFKHTPSGRILNNTLIDGKPSFLPSKGTFPMTAVLLGRCSGVAGVLGWNDVQWKNETRFFAGLVLAQEIKLPIAVTTDESGKMAMTIAGHKVSVSGHIMVAVFYTLIRGPSYDYGLNGTPDLISTLGGMTYNARVKCISWEPSFSSPAWHTWFEFAAGILAGIRAVGIVMKLTGARISKRRAVYVKLVLKHYWRRIAITARSSLETTSTERGRNDTRFSVLRPD